MTASYRRLEGQAIEVAKGGKVSGAERQGKKPAEDWREGRMVFRLPEVRNSVAEKSHIIYSDEDARVLARTMAATVMRRRTLSPGELEAQLERIEAMEQVQVNNEQQET